MEGWIAAGILCLVVAIVSWQLWTAHKQTGRLQHQLLEAERLFKHIQAEEQHLHLQQVAMGLVIPEALIVLDDKQSITWVNDATRQLFGECLGKSIIEATRAHELNDMLDNTRPTEEVIARQITLGQQRFDVRLVKAGEKTILSLQDTSELQRLGRARRDFVANISHELRTPLASIRLLVDTLQAGALSDTAIAQDMLAKINAELDTLSQLARELLDLALIESGQMPLKLTVNPLDKIVASQIERFSPQARQKDIDLLAEVPPELPVLADWDMAGRVLSNLLHNALKFTPAGGQVRLSARGEGDNVLVSVSDTGPGIPPEAASRIFERFYKLDRARGQAGTGLGLAIARHIVEGHGGRIWAESKPGRGAVFHFTLPAG
jgi:two-component system phosphate regulon sensor histidine kinase PhoR